MAKKRSKKRKISALKKSFKEQGWVFTTKTHLTNLSLKERNETATLLKESQRSELKTKGWSTPFRTKKYICKNINRIKYVFSLNHNTSTSLLNDKSRLIII